ncbi:lysophospholipid acyltransferase family protein [Mycoplasmopsis verecunda]|uniref:1-acyl-sn-glycerol-3-phosphate acyltransferase n=1 Tax=Mycoplasmopsis verecunda TaxID=171291 RepID=A0A1T4KQS7_9BACT|nr:lysophospholipid acyltransferase family protein [Mycoplasmopsis verecunda]WPB54699.1 lysophospholipid acyltransferase family protein [Mycoplasmopsis verecunda]SJZ44687.1 1-acyl-sn-glycerol-3-phosphate acyltransferase [Mycoplasmopsis verecunda]
MKKHAIDIRFKRVLLAPIWFLRWLKIKLKFRKFKKDPDQFSAIDRYNYLLKLSKKILKIYNVDVVVKGYDNVLTSGNVIFTPNHKSLFDPLVLMVALENPAFEQNSKLMIPTFIAKKEISESKWLNAPVSLLDTFYVDRKSVKQSLKEMTKFADFIKENKTYGVIFPEGTRVTDETLGHFVSGPFWLAQKKYLAIQPVVIKNTLNAMDAKRKGRLTVEVEFLPALKPNTFLTQESSSLASHVHSLIKNEVEKDGDQN